MKTTQNDIEQQNRQSNRQPSKQQFSELIHQHQGIINKVCRLYCQDEGERADLQQDILLQMWRAFPSFKGQSKFSTWAYRIAFNTAVANFRKYERKSKLFVNRFEIDEGLQPTVQPFEDADQKAANQQQVNSLQRAIQQLSKVERAIIMLYLEAHSYNEIATIMGISTSLVGVKINRIKSKLKKTITHEYHG